ncbi:MAG TPA: hypothetical protein VGP93_16505, partial [Polyangiaceae bacterium]|nr:hypothetical protein [Polyangiaceae bacterium]
RRRVAALRAIETLPPAISVQSALQAVLSARGLAMNADELLGAWDLAPVRARRPSEISRAELRSVSLALALSDERASVLALYEPLATGLPRERVLETLRRLAGSVVILSLTSSLDDARALGAMWHVLEAGVLSPARQEAFTLASGSSKTLVVRAADARKLAARLAQEAAISAVSWDERRSQSELSISGSDAAAMCDALLRVSLEHELPLESVSPLVPPLEAVLAARAGLVRSAYENAAARHAPAGAIFAPSPYQTGAGYQSPSAPAPSAQSLGLAGPAASQAAPGQEDPKP